MCVSPVYFSCVFFHIYISMESLPQQTQQVVPTSSRPKIPQYFAPRSWSRSWLLAIHDPSSIEYLSNAKQWPGSPWIRIPMGRVRYIFTDPWMNGWFLWVNVHVDKYNIHGSYGLADIPMKSGFLLGGKRPILQEICFWEGIYWSEQHSRPFWHSI